MEITKDIARKVLETVDAGLVAGIGDPVPGKMCVEAAVCYAMGLPHGDEPSCVSPALRALKIRLNDARWSSDTARAKGMRRLAVLQLGSAAVLDEIAFVQRLVPFAAAAATATAAHAAYADATAAAAHAATAAAAHATTDAAATAAATAAAAAAYAHAAHAAHAAYAHAATAAAADATADAVLTKFADDAADILIDMQVPGVQWLPLLTDEKDIMHPA